MDAAGMTLADAATELLGNDPWVFVALTLVLFGAAAYMTGQALAQNWRPAWHTVAYTMLLAIGSRFLSFALFDGDLLSLSGAAIDWAALLVIAVLAYRLNRVGLMVRQYPWLYERKGPFAWREKRS